MPGIAAKSERIPDLPASGTLTGMEMFPIIQGGRTVNVLLSQVAAFLGSTGPATTPYGLLGADGAQLLGADGAPLQYAH